MPNWPASLPQKPLANSFQESAPETAIRTQMDQGPDKLRQRFTAGVRNLQFQMTMTPTQVETLDDFYVNSLGGGSISFDWTHPRTGNNESFRFVEAPNYSQITKGAVSVSVSLEIVPS